MTIKSFRGILDDGAQDTIRLSTKQGKIGYRIVKFQTFPNEPGEQNIESTAKIYKTPRPESATGVITVDNTVDFSDNNLLAAAYYQDGTDTNFSGSAIVIFDNEIFNQDIYITAIDVTSNQKTNYYIELETMKLNDNEAAASTLMDIRGSS